MRLRCFLLILGVVLGLVGCASTQFTPDVQASLANIRFVGVTVMETTMEFEVRIENATPETIRLDGAVHKITLNGLYLGRGLTGETVEIPRFASATQKVQMHLSNLRMATRVRAMVETQKMDYRMESVLHAAGRSSFSCYREGILDLTVPALQR